MKQPVDPDDIKPLTDIERTEVEALKRGFSKGDDFSRIYQLLDGQLAVLHTRALALVQVAGVIITVTGFSGRIIADTNVTAQLLIVTGLSLVVLAAALAIGFVMPVRWISTYIHLDPEKWMAVAIRRRNRKTNAFWVASIILLFGMTFYIGSISIMLMNPQAAELKKVR
ncbi:hypothetical protein GC173_13470 [bacterium]|nr:hypothetical protein [bacterium]